jgi:hypothetical protein
VEGRLLLKSETGQWPIPLKKKKKKKKEEEEEEEEKKTKKKIKKTAGQPHEAPDVIGRVDIYVPQKANCDVRNTSS